MDGAILNHDKILMATPEELSCNWRQLGKLGLPKPFSTHMTIHKTYCDAYMVHFSIPHTTLCTSSTLSPDASHLHLVPEAHTHLPQRANLTAGRPSKNVNYLYL
jgi:hypothetical protein